MRRTRFSIAGLMGFVLIVALGFGGLKNANPVWASLCYTVAFVSLVIGVLVAIQARGRFRAFFVGFSVTGWLYFTFTFILPTTSEYEPPPQFFSTMALDLAQSLFFLDGNNVTPVTFVPTPSSVPPLPVAGSFGPTTIFVTPTPPQGTTVPTPPTPVTSAVTSNALPTTVVNASTTVGTTFSFPINSVPMPSIEPQTSFRHVGQSMATMLLAYLGGLLSIFLASSRERNEANRDPSSP